MPTTDAILDRQLRRWELERQLSRSARAADEPRPGHQPVITVSRQKGSGGSLLAGKLAERFDYTLLHRDLIDRICATTGLQKRIVESLDGHARSELALWFESVVAGSFIDASDYVRALLETIYSVARLGGVVVVGRGANYIIGHDGGFHLRVVAPREVRVATLAAREGITLREAARAIDHSDRERSEFVRKLYRRDIDDPLGYDLVINHLSISVEAAVSLIAAAAMEKFERLRTSAPTVHAGGPERKSA